MKTSKMEALLKSEMVAVKGGAGRILCVCKSAANQKVECGCTSGAAAVPPPASCVCSTNAAVQNDKG